MNGMEIKKSILKEIMDMMDEEMLSKIKKPGVPEEMDITKIKVEKADAKEMPEEGAIEEDKEEIDEDILQQLMQMHEDKPEEE